MATFRLYYCSTKSVFSKKWMTVNEKEQVMKDKENVLSKGKDRARIKYLRKKEKEKKEKKERKKMKKRRRMSSILLAVNGVCLNRVYSFLSGWFVLQTSWMFTFASIFLWVWLPPFHDVGGLRYCPSALKQRWNRRLSIKSLFLFPVSRLGVDVKGLLCQWLCWVYSS